MGAVAASAATKHAMAASTISRTCIDAPVNEATHAPTAAVSAIAMGMMNQPRMLFTEPRIEPSLVHPQGILDQQVHARGESQHHADQRSPRRPAVLAIQPPADEQTE